MATSQEEAGRPLEMVLGEEAAAGIGALVVAGCRTVAGEESSEGGASRGSFCRVHVVGPGTGRPEARERGFSGSQGWLQGMQR